MPDFAGSDQPSSHSNQAPHRFIPLVPFNPGTTPELGAKRFYDSMKLRRTVRMFSDRPVSQETIEWICRAAGTAPSGANKQPWQFVAINDAALKHELRTAAEAEEREFYAHKANDEWLADLGPFGTDANKPFLDTAPWLIVVFKYAKTPQGGQVYYTNESVGIAVGLLLAAAHHAGLVTLTHTPSPMAFLSKILRRPDYERPYLLIPVGYPDDDCTVPDVQRKPLEQIMTVNRG